MTPIRATGKKLGMEEQSIKILLIEDNLAEAKLFQEFLSHVKQSNFEIVWIKKLREAFIWLEEKRFDIILLDLTLPDARGLESLESLNVYAPHLPIVVLTNTNDEELAIEAVKKGAQDYLVKRLINLELLHRALLYALERKQAADALRRANEELENRVRYRTAELELANELLKQEIRDRQNIELALDREKELALTTLNSIGDAVITTDVGGYITSLNPVAETLTGWQETEAKGKIFAEVVRLFDPNNNCSISNLVPALSTTKFPDRTLLKSRGGTEFVIEHSAAPIRLANGLAIGTVIVCRDVTYADRLANQLAWQARHDPLTGLSNRRQFEENLKEALVDAEHNSNQHILCYLDLDRFKLVNDTCGHTAGDELLRQVSALLETQIRKTDIIARLGGDEFALLLYNCSLQEGKTVASKLLEIIQGFRFSWEEKIFNIGVSIGLVSVDNSADNFASILSAADTAMYVAKEQGRNRLHIFETNDRLLAQRRGDMQWVSKIVKTLEENRFCLYSQPIVSLQEKTRSIHHYEILLRMQDEDGNLIMPMAFIPAAERYDLMPKIDRWVISTLFKGLQENSLLLESISLYTVNLSGASFNDEKFLNFLQEQFSIYQIPPAKICFEVTETLAITNINKAIQFIRQLKQLGCYFALDDFGSGMSSLAYLKNLPVDYLKIDGHFIKNIIEEPINAAMVEAIARIGQVMGLQTIAEFVENECILNKLQQLGIDYAQGYQIAKPSPLNFALRREQIYLAQKP
jgi:diguanylate cyclase (GGDEF)-like protein/PAS domain S-box-containing protein